MKTAADTVVEQKYVHGDNAQDNQGTAQREHGDEMRWFFCFQNNQVDDKMDSGHNPCREKQLI
ncbi:MAG: hypothetical protein JW904_10495 [Spirochaetales bacterium]|nr:hypothetical protein [Spirochaetales bacterium]